MKMGIALDNDDHPILDSFILTAWGLCFGFLPWALYEIAGQPWSTALIYLGLSSVGGVSLL